MRIFVSLFAAVLAASLFVGCGGEKVDDGTQTIVLYDTGIEEVNQQKWEKAIQNFEARHLNTEVQFNPFKDDDYSQGGTLLAALRSKNPPDVYFEWTWAAVERDATNGTALDLTPYIDDEWKESLDPRSFAGTDFQGKTYMIPEAFDVANIMFYRREKLEALGLEVPETWEDFLDACKKLRADGETPIVMGNVAAWTCGNWAAEISSVYLGIENYRKAGQADRSVPLTHEGFVQALTRFDELRQIEAFNSDINTINDSEANSRFATGEGAFLFTGAWVMDVLFENGGAEVFGIARHPKLPGAPEEHNYILANSTGYMVHANTPDPARAVDLIREVTSAPIQKIRVEGGLSVVNKEAIGAIESAMQNQLMQITDQSDVWVAAPDISWDERVVAEILYEAVREVIAGNMTPEAALAQAEKDAVQAVK